MNTHNIEALFDDPCEDQGLVWHLEEGLGFHPDDILIHACYLGNGRYRKAHFRRQARKKGA